MKIFKILLWFVIFACSTFALFFWDDKDVCLDSGWCKEGMEINNENGCFIINKKSCIENGGIWKSDKKICHFKSAKCKHN